MTAPRVLVATPATHYSLLIASTEDDVRGAQALRHQIFAEEMAARLHSPEPRLDVDAPDEHCDHLIVRDDRTGQTVGTYRMLPPGRTDRLYSEGEFHVGPLAPLRERLVETGRSCVHPDHRSGAVINLMWAGIARYLHLTGHRWLAGCASVPVTGDPTAAAAVWQVVRDRHLAPPRLRVRPLQPYPVGPAPERSRAELLARVPALLRGYLRIGAWVCGEPAHDVDFGVADFLVLLSLDRVDPRYLRHFLGETA